VLAASENPGKHPSQCFIKQIELGVSFAGSQCVDFVVSIHNGYNITCFREKSNLKNASIRLLCKFQRRFFPAPGRWSRFARKNNRQIEEELL
jgi:hypothetical protein